MRKLLLFLLFATPTCAQTFNVPIKNPSFEEAVPAQYQRTCGTYTYEVPEWTVTGTAAVVIPKNPLPLTCEFSILPADGKQMVVVQNGTISQNLGDVSKMPFADKNGGVDGTFTLHVFVANYFYWYPGKFSVSLSLFCQSGNTLCAEPGTQGAGNTEVLCSISGIGSGDFRDIPLVCPSQRQYGELILTLGSTGYQMFFDNVSLTFTKTN